jgi:hypothetical protein
MTNRIGQKGPDEGKECGKRTASGVKTVKRMVQWKTIKNAR